jgi:hypothetical protein
MKALEKNNANRLFQLPWKRRDPTTKHALCTAYIYTFAFNGVLETAVEDSRMFSLQDGALETGLHLNEDELLSIGLFRNEKNCIGHAF